MNSSFHKSDVILLLKDITGLVEPMSSKEREACIQKGIHYSELLPLEYQPSKEYMEVYQNVLEVFGQAVADAIAAAAECIIRKKGKDAVLVSLARAGTPLGILIKRYIAGKYGFQCPHYSISIIREKGIDKNAMAYILDRHEASQIQFIDGWTGKGTIYRELQKDVSAYPGVSDELAVVADPAYLTRLCGTHEDILIPSACLNSTISGLISRTFYRADLISEQDFHGAAYYKELTPYDKTYEFIDTIESLFRYDADIICASSDFEPEAGMKEVQQIAQKYDISDIHYVKPGIGETTRVLLRRVPWKILINPTFKESAALRHILQLAKDRNVPVEEYPLKQYKSCGIIKHLSDV